MPKDNLFVPRIIHIDITGKCNFECLHCRGRFSNKSIELSHFKRIIDNIFENWNNDLKWMEIGGGEPLLHKDLAKMIHYIKKKNKKIRIIVVSNGSLFNEKKAKELKSAGITRIQFSLDGVNAETHNWLRQNDSSFRKVMDAIEIAKIITENFAEPEFQVKSIPISDGGDGFLNICQNNFHLEIVPREIRSFYDDTFSQVPVGVSIDHKIIYIESAEIIGMKKIPLEKRNPSILNSSNLGELLIKLEKEFFILKFKLC